MSHAKQLVSRPRKYPFVNMRLADYKVLDGIEGRHDCIRCNRSRKYFCYSCYVPVGDVASIIPHVSLPVQIDIIKHKKEIDGKSTAVHAAILAPDRVTIYTYPDIPDYTCDREGTILIFPSAESRTMWQLFEHRTPNTDHLIDLPKGYNVGTLLKRRLIDDKVEEDLYLDLQKLQLNGHLPENKETKGNDKKDIECETTKGNNYGLPIRRAVFIDSTWSQSRGLYKDERIKSLPTVVLQNRCSQFWRYQRGCPRWYLSTIEAIHQFLLELHTHAWGLNVNYRGLDNLEIEENFRKRIKLIDSDEDDVSAQAPYNGQYDNLMFFFANMYDLIHKYYDHKTLKSYNRDISPTW